ncbi:DUF2290 domain-containing protein [Enterococcus faecalis]|nr:DUF2290 domain-containing protein [Enterococcus faecalis]
MNISKLLISYKSSLKILRDTGLLKTENTTRAFDFSFSKFSTDFVNCFMDSDYEEIFKVSMQNGDYDILLNDDSFFQFSCENTSGGVEKGNIRYAYYEKTRDYKTYSEFLTDLDFNYSDVGEEFLGYYEQYISEAKLKTSVTPIRYDYDIKNFKSVSHPISHFHIGFNNEIRLPVDKIILPVDFVMFILQNVYPAVFKKCYDENLILSEFRTSKSKCEILSIDHFCDDTKKRLFLS